MTPERLDEIPYDAKQEIERLQAELATIKPGYEEALRIIERQAAWIADKETLASAVVSLRAELEQAKSEQIHCMACGGVECHRLAEIVQLTGMESDQHLVEWVAQAKEQYALLKAGYKIEVSRSLDFEKQFKQAKERERQLREKLTSCLNNGAGTVLMYERQEFKRKVEELESANARLKQHIELLLDDWVHPDSRLDAVAALTAPPAKADEREAWLDGRARVEPAKEKP